MNNYTDAEHRRDRALDMQNDADDERRDVRAARDINTEHVRMAIRVLEEEFNHDWFRGLPEFDFSEHERRLRELDMMRGLT